MANMVIEAKRVKAGNALTQFETTALNAVNQLKAIKTQLLDLKAQVNSDTDFTAEDTTVVQSVIDELAEAVQGILS